MDSWNPDELITEVKEEQQTRGELATEALQWFLDGNVGELFPRSDVVDRLSNELDITNRQANTAISDTVGDIVDPVQQIVKSNKKYVGVIDYKIFNDEGAYGYVDFDDRKGQRKRVVCARCVEKHTYDENINHATQGEGSSDVDASWQQLLNKVTSHYATQHTTSPSHIEPGASLVSGTTISGNTAFHAGNESNIDHNNLSNRTHSGDNLTPSSVSSDTLEATSSITDPEGNTVTSLSDPVRVTEEASTFTESGVTVTNNKTTVDNDSVKLPDVVLGTTADRTNDDNFTPATRRRGIQINPNTDIDGIQLTLSQNTSGATTAYLVNDSTGADLQTTDISGKNAGDTVEFIETLSSGTEYRAVADDNGAEYDAGIFDTGTITTFSSSDIDITAGMDGGNEVTFYANFTDVTAITATDISSGDALVEFNSGIPEDIESYDIATLQRTLDGETVTIDVEDSNGNVLKSDISKDTDISDIATSRDVQFRANFSRNDTANNPTVDYLARRFTR